MVNDAPALKQADIGFSMGEGTAVAQEAGDVVILNNSLESIKSCVLNSRTMAKSISKFLIFQLTINVATLIMNILAPITGVENPFSIVQILAINLVMDTIASICYAGEAVLERYMDEKPAKRKAPILTPYMKSAIGMASIYTTIGSLIILCFGNSIFTSLGFGENFGEETLKTVMFAFFMYSALFNGFNTRSEKLNIFEGIKDNKYFLTIMPLLFVLETLIVQFGGKVFGTVTLSANVLLFSFLLSAFVIPVDFIRKAIINSMNKD